MNPELVRQIATAIRHQDDAVPAGPQDIRSLGERVLVTMLERVYPTARAQDS